MHAYRLSWYTYIMTKDLRLARRIRAELAYHGVSANRMAARLGMSQSAFASRLTGQVDFRFGEIQAIARELGIPLSRLIPDETKSLTDGSGKAEPCPAGCCPEGKS